MALAFLAAGVDALGGPAMLGMTVVTQYSTSLMSAPSRAQAAYNNYCAQAAQLQTLETNLNTLLKIQSEGVGIALQDQSINDLIANLQSIVAQDTILYAHGQIDMYHTWGWILLAALVLYFYVLLSFCEPDNLLLTKNRGRVRNVMSLNLLLACILLALAIWLLFQKVPPPPPPPPTIQTYLPRPIGTSINTATPLMTGGLCLQPSAEGVALQNCNAASNAQSWYLDCQNGSECVTGVSGYLTSVGGPNHPWIQSVVSNYDAFGSQAITISNQCLSAPNANANVVLQTSSVLNSDGAGGSMSNCAPWTVGGNSTPNVFVPPTQSTLNQYVQPITNLTNAYDLISTNTGLGVGVQISNADGTLCLDTTINGLSMQACEVMPKCNSGQLWQYYRDNKANQQICLWHQSENEQGFDFWRDYCPGSPGSDGDGSPICSTANNTHYNALCLNNYGANFNTMGMYRAPNWNDSNDNLLPQSNHAIMAFNTDSNPYFLQRSNGNVNATISLVSANTSPKETQQWYVLDQLSQIPFALRGEGATCQ